MTPRASGLVFDIAAISALLLEKKEVGSRASIIAQTVCEALPDAAVVVYVLRNTQDSANWESRAIAGEGIEPDPLIPFESGTLGSLGADQQPAIFLAEDVPREEYGHLNVRRTLQSLAYLPILASSKLIGAIEVASFEEPLFDSQLAALRPLTDLAGPALSAAASYEEERQESLVSISRLTQFYDIEKVFSTTLEMEQLLPIIAGKLRETLNCVAVNIWLVQADESLLLMEQAGFDPTAKKGDAQRPGEGVAGDVSDDGEPVLIADAFDERLLQRNSVLEGGEIEVVQSLMVAPLLDQGALVGVVEAVNKLDATSFDDDDLFVLVSLNETASQALHNASLLMAERKVEILETLVTVSQEITSTLNLERMLQTIVNAPQAVIPYDRAAIALEQNGKYKLSAVTGMVHLDTDSPQIVALNEVLRWVMLSEEEIDIRQRGEQVEHPREETRAKFQKYFADTGMRAFYAIPLNDDTGRVGILALEGSSPDYLTPAHVEILKVLAGQATVALRNAQMYKEVPFISLLEPVLEKKRKFLAMKKRKRQAILIAVAAALLFLVAVPLPLRVEGDAVIAPVHTEQVQAEVEGIVNQVYVHEGDRVSRGQVLATLSDWDYRAALAGSEAKYQTALLQMNRSLSTNDGGEAGVQRVQADYWKSEVERARGLLQATQLRSSLDGIVATPHVENMVGRRLQQGDTFAEVVDTSQAIVDVAIDSEDAGLLRKGSPASVKLNSYPTRIFRGEVAVVSPKAEVQGSSRVLFARVAVINPQSVIRAGMEGRGKVRAGWSPAGYVLFRRPLLWMYSHVWSWFGL